MKEIRFIHCADIHLDAPFTSLGSEKDKSSKRRQDLKNTFQRIIDIVKSERSELLLISGDLFEHSYTAKPTISFLNSCFRSIPETKVFIVPGNHDPYVTNSFYKISEWNSNVTILSEDKPFCKIDELNTCIYGIGFSSFAKENNTDLAELKPADSNYINILLAHGTVDMNIGDGVYNPMSSNDLAALGMNYIALGHFHNRIDNIGGKGLVYNPGSPEPLGFDETGEHGIYKGSIVKQDNGEVLLNVNFISLNSKSYNIAEIKVDGCGSNEEIISQISQYIENKDLSKTLLSLTLKGYIENGFRIDTQSIPLSFKDKIYYLKLKDETGINFDIDQISKEPGLKGLYTRKMLKRIEDCEDVKEKGILQKALYYGLEALENGKLEI